MSLKVSNVHLRKRFFPQTHLTLFSVSNMYVFQYPAKSRHLLKISTQDSSRETTHRHSTLPSQALLLGLHFPNHKWSHRPWTAIKETDLPGLDQHPISIFLGSQKNPHPKVSRKYLKEHDDLIPAPPSLLFSSSVFN